MQEAICTVNLTRDFQTVRAVDNLCLSVPQGIVFGFLGPNGSGKTTTIRLLLGLLQPTTGGASVLGFDICKQADEIRKRCGALLEHSGLYERLSALDNLEFYGRVWQIPSLERRARIKELLQHFDLWDRRKEIVATWSRGMKQKLAISRALLHRPSLVFLDEPSAGLDPVAAAALRDDIARLAKSEGVTVFLTTHNLAEAERLCAQVGVIRGGKLLAVGHPNELKERASSPRAEVVGRGISDSVVSKVAKMNNVRVASVENGRLIVDYLGNAAIPELVRLLVQEGVEVEEVRRGAASLEEAFLGLMEAKA